jgi:3-oxoacyl-[acyl-carrier-protein] synthase-1
MTDGVEVVAVGARTPLGLAAESSAAAVRAGIGRVAEHPVLVDCTHEPVKMAWDSELDPALAAPQRMIELAASAIDEVAGKLNLGSRNAPIPILLGLPEARPGLSQEQLRDVAHAIARRAPTDTSLQAFPAGHAAGLLALERAIHTMESGQTDIAFVVGVDSYMDPYTVQWLDDNRQLANARNRGAFFPGEGAGAFVIVSTAAAQRSGLRSLGTLHHVATAMEPKRIKTDAVCIGEGLAVAIRGATASLRLPQEAIEGVLCDINGERYRSDEWGFAMLRMPEVFVDPTDYELPTSCWGDMGAASAPLNVVLATRAATRGYAKGRRYLLWNSSESGLRAAAVLELRL